MGREAWSQGRSYKQYLLELAEIEHTGRAENRLKKLIGAASFPALKTHYSLSFR